MQLSKQIDDLCSKKSALERSTMQAQGTILELEQRVVDFQEQLLNSSNKLSLLEQEYASYKTSINEAQQETEAHHAAQVEEWKARLAKLEQENGMILDQCETYRGQVASQEGKNYDLEQAFSEQINVQKQQFKSFKDQMQMMELKLKESNNTVQHMEDANFDLQQENKRQAQQIESLKQTVHQKEAELVQSKSTSTNTSSEHVQQVLFLQNRISSLESDVKLKEQDLKLNESKITSLARELNIVLDDFSRQEQESHTKLQNLRAYYEQKVADLNSKFSDTSVQLHSTQQQLTMANGELAHKQQAYTELSHKMDTLSNKLIQQYQLDIEQMEQYTESIVLHSLSKSMQQGSK